MAKVEVPITPDVLRWAIERSGFTSDDVAQAAHVPVSTLHEWLAGRSRPALTHVRKLATKLHRPIATFLLPRPPKRRELLVEFRHPLNTRGELNPDERRYLRRALRLQEVLSWLAGELAVDPPSLPRTSVAEDPPNVAQKLRLTLKVSLDGQLDWESSSVAFDSWRAALEKLGVVVFLFSIGKESCRGFSTWDERTPLVAVNTAWNEEARIFTLFHEVGHLITRTSSACVADGTLGDAADPTERWCERLAAGVLVSGDDAYAAVRRAGWSPGTVSHDLSLASEIAHRYKVSLRAAVIRLIELSVTNWDLYRRLPATADSKQRGWGGRGRTRRELREDQLSARSAALFVEAVEKEILSRSQALDYLDIRHAEFDGLAHSVRLVRKH